MQIHTPHCHPRVFFQHLCIQALWNLSHIYFVPISNWSSPYRIMGQKQRTESIQTLSSPVGRNNKMIASIPSTYLVCLQAQNHFPRGRTLCPIFPKRNQRQVVLPGFSKTYRTNFSLILGVYFKIVNSQPEQQSKKLSIIPDCGDSALHKEATFQLYNIVTCLGALQKQKY